MTATDTESRRERLQRLRAEVAQLEREVTAEAELDRSWQTSGYYLSYYATTGFMLGAFGAITSLLFNVVGSAMVGQNPLRLIQVYLTFPLGEKALNMESGLALSVGCCLYIGTGMLLGTIFQVVLTRFAMDAGLVRRLLISSVLAAAIWIVNFYLLLSWLQPLLIGDNWIVKLVPWWVGLLTHLVFGWTMAVVFPLGLYRPYQVQTEAS